MLSVAISGHATLTLEHLVLDVNGTIALDGALLPGVAELLAALRPTLTLHLVTADTHGRQHEIDRELGLTATLLPAGIDQAEAKAALVRGLGVGRVAAIGNGANYSGPQKLDTRRCENNVGQAEMRKQYTAAFKAEIVQEALREDRLVTQIASAHGIHPNLIGEWKATALKGLPSLFEREHSEQARERASHDKQVTELYADIGRLTTQVAWMNKKAGIRDE